jgi:competence protein CoiA
MKFALINNTKTEATPGVTGTCPSCGSELIAKCGKIKMHHWAHKGARNCDPWWENETEWHRSWKNNFPVEWQELPLPDEQTGEKHIADVRTSDGLVIEFQNSPIDLQERTTREKFYKDMVWVVNGTRGKSDYPRFLKGYNHFWYAIKEGIFRVEHPEACFPIAWLECSVPVLFDFQGAEPRDNIHIDTNKNLYCLFPLIGSYATIAEIPRSTFIYRTTNGEWLSRVRNFMDKLIQEDKERRERQSQIDKQTLEQMGNALTSTKNRIRPY